MTAPRVHALPLGFPPPIADCCSGDPNHTRYFQCVQPQDYKAVPRFFAARPLSH
jgi:hypothetical protein